MQTRAWRSDDGACEGEQVRRDTWRRRISVENSGAVVAEEEVASDASTSVRAGSTNWRRCILLGVSSPSNRGFSRVTLWRARRQRDRPISPSFSLSPSLFIAVSSDGFSFAARFLFLPSLDHVNSRIRIIEIVARAIDYRERICGQELSR